MYTTLFNKCMSMAALLLMTGHAALAAPKTVEPFDQTTWRRLVAESASPAIVVFSSVTCSHCPGTIDKISAQLAAAQSRTRLMIVSIDSEEDEALLRDPHYASASRVFAFNGAMQPLQYAVNPDWRGMTPYVAYLDGKKGVRFTTGEPRASVLREWLGARR
jgi:hypothetical protein